MPYSPEHIVYSRPVVESDEADFCLCLERIDLLFQLDYVQRMGEFPAGLEHFSLPEDEIVRRLQSPQGNPCWIQTADVYLPDADRVLTQRLQFLVDTFDLTPGERDILLVALLPRLSDHYARLPEGELGESVSRSLLTRLFATSQIAFQLLQSALHPASPLFRFQLLTELKPVGNRKSPSTYALNIAVWHFFCGNDRLTTSLHAWTHRAETDASAWYPAALVEPIARLCLTPADDVPPIVVLEGYEQDGRERALATLLAEHGRSLLCVNAEGLASLPEAQQQQAIIGIVRDALLDNAVLLLENVVQPSAVEHSYLQTLTSLLKQIRLPVVVLADAAATVPVFSGLACVHIAMPQPTLDEKAALLQKAWSPRPAAGEKQALFNLAQRYAFNPADVSQLMQEAEYYRQLRDSTASLKPDDLRQALAHRTRKNFGKLAQRITPTRTFDDLVISTAMHKQLAEILATIRLRESVTEKHFSHKTGGKAGVSALFYGDSGTGKTLAAEVLAQHLAVDLIKVDLSNVVNKYVGETEKNLARIFDLAQADSGVLFFDEADALFGKRSETKDAHDRHANIEVSYLLQRLENYPGLVILATNNRNHLDSAFNRRFTFITRFTWPDAALRAQMWQAIWPKTLKLADDVDFSQLGTRSELTGANIRNVALLAAVLAAEEKSKKIHLHHIEHAISRELGKLGRLAL
ncbi:ATPase family protein associated with various cellular activities (AAA) [Enterobacter sp. BIGb0383]|uniref:ATP-binding protein n=1 Tax=unclassified Enterobacter TaxID=2608935 RepID=UPI000F495F5D|nr:MULTISPECIES: ATP-binding protein [unclassified Enterobacter]ROP62287.1 ATPase family protein associated with various cellular activities (AAA) [Enterobacter sp. BIGb0383]ROS12448.1 ATPase family protein associated with various cellular activities (AAA) [Enterobacter sp. BIGb0359]